jgi:hypothetical protein
MSIACLQQPDEYDSGADAHGDEAGDAPSSTLSPHAKRAFPLRMRDPSKRALDSFALVMAMKTQ